MEWNDEEHQQSCEEVDRFLYGVIDELIDNNQEIQWLKYDESCMSIKYSLLIKTIYDLILREGWTPDMIKNDCLHHIKHAKKILKDKDKPKKSNNTDDTMSEEEFLERLEKAKAKYLD